MAENTGDVLKAHRSLAAIVFTDICGFSQLAQEDEDRALKLAERDLTFMRKLCDRCGGRVLKSTGDGLLMHFGSAVQAVTCAMQAQKAFAEAATRLPEDQLLKHRVGIHLGDVFVTSDDVMGDGVNVASRLQEQADPGGICVSQTVYDVVKNRLAVHATYLGPRELKNIQEAVPVYQILADAAAQAGQPTTVHKGGRRIHGWMIAAGAGGLAVVLLAMVIGMLLAGGNEPSQEPAPPAPSSSESAASQRVSAESPTADPPPRRPQPDGLLGGRDFQPFAEARREFLDEGNLAGLIAWMDENDYGETPMAEMYRNVQAFLDTVRQRLLQSTPEKPLRFKVPSRATRSVMDGQAWSTEDGKVAVEVGGRREVFDLLSIPLRLKAAMAMAVAQTEQDRESVRFLVHEMRLAGGDAPRRPPQRRP